MMNNPYLVSHYPRQPNVVIIVTDIHGEMVTVYNKLATLDLFVMHGVTILEVREYAGPETIDPVNVTTLVNPRRWMFIAKPDPEKIAAL